MFLRSGVLFFLKAALPKVQIEISAKFLDAVVDNAEVLFSNPGQAPVSLEHLDDVSEAANLITGLVRSRRHASSTAAPQ